MEATLRIVGADGLYKSTDRHEPLIFNVLLHRIFPPAKSRVPHRFQTA